MALIVPVLAYLMLGAADLGRAFYLNVEISGASRAGMRAGVADPGNDIGLSARSEPNSAIPNNAATWGSTGPGGTSADCTSGTQQCGDPNGCPTSVFTGNPSQLACFAVRSGTYTAGSGCSFTGSSWNTRPASGSDGCLGVRVVYKFTPVTPFIAQLAGSGGTFYLTVDTSGLELY